MKNKKKLLLIELNEINFDIVKKYNLKFNFKFFNKSFFSQLKKTKSEDDYDLLEPWIQWVSIHTGKSAKEHKIFRLGDIKNFSHEQIFDIIEKKKKTVGAICPMNVKNNLNHAAYFISDPWTKTVSGPGLWNKFVAKNISEIVNANSHKKINYKILINILIIIIKSFRFVNLRLYFNLFFKSLFRKWNKALILDLILHDIHMKLIKKNNVDFSTIFFNAGAHIQHHYFLNSFYIKKFSNIKNPSWYIKENYDPLEDMILFYDNILYEYSLLKDYEIILATGLCQIPYDRVKYYYRLVNHENFLRIIKINFLKVEPRMTRDFLVSFNNEKDLEDAFEKLNLINLLNKKEIFEIDKRKLSLFISLVISFEINENYSMNIDTNRSVILKNHVSFVALKNGMHSSTGYIFSSFKMNDIVNVKEIFKEINNYF